MVRNGTHRAVFIMAGPGIGKSAVTDAVTERLAGNMKILRIHASSALAGVPFGVLTPYTGELTAEESVSPVAVLRSMWSYFEKLKAGSGGAVLLAVDDAHHLDDASAGVLAEVISAGWATVLAAARPRPGLPQPLDQLWYDGLAERVDLRPLNREQIEEVLDHVLDGTVPAATVDSIWNASSGNPRILDALLHDSAEAGVLAKRNGIWMLLGPLPADGDRLAGVVAKDHLRRRTEEQEALKLIALAGPVGRKVIEDISGAAVVRSLLDQQIIVEAPGIPAELSIWNGLFAGAIRNTVSVSRSLQLLEKVRAHQDPTQLRGEGRLRAVEWALECGVRVSDDEMLAAAKEALLRFRNDSARSIASRIHDPAMVPLAQAIQARALYNEGAYTGAAALLDECWLRLADDPQGPAVLLLRVSAHLAIGHPLGMIADDVEKNVPLSSDGERSWQEGLLHLLHLGAEVNFPALNDEVDTMRKRPRQKPQNRSAPWLRAFSPTPSARRDAPCRGWRPHCWQPRNFPRSKAACSSSLSSCWEGSSPTTWPWVNGSRQSARSTITRPDTRLARPPSTGASSCCGGIRCCGRGGWNALIRSCCPLLRR
ncbi:hypothetical protein OUO20_03095 [Arthrobacter sp. FX8]|nr:hypothetical protein [Arthrobacter sp. FX8]WAJ33999.1 hypothetical protein OUO20_03095 [Arthrobacter sp. FX8]